MLSTSWRASASRSWAPPPPTWCVRSGNRALSLTFHRVRSMSARAAALQLWALCPPTDSHPPGVCSLSTQRLQHDSFPAVALCSIAIECGHALLWFPTCRLLLCNVLQRRCTCSPLPNAIRIDCHRVVISVPDCCVNVHCCWPLCRLVWQGAADGRHGLMMQVI